MVARFELLAFVQLVVPLLLSSSCTRVIFLRHPFKRSLDILIQVRLLNLGRVYEPIGVNAAASLAHVAERHGWARGLLAFIR